MNWLRRCFKEIVSEKVIFIFAFLSICLFEIIIILSNFSVTKAEACMLDALVYCSEGMWVNIFLVIPFFATLLCSKNWIHTRVVKSGNVENIWSYTYFKTAMVSFLYSLHILFFSLLTGYLYSGKVCNWNETSSHYRLHNESTVNGTNPIEIGGSFLVNTFFTIFILGIIIIVIRWIFDKYIIAVVLSLSICLCTYYSNTGFYTERIISYRSLQKDVNIMYVCIYPAIAAIMIYFLGRFKSHREFWK